MSNITKAVIFCNIILWCFLGTFFITFSDLENQIIDIHYEYNYVPNYDYLENASMKQFNQSIYDLEIDEYKILINENYEYTEIKDCKYWSYLNYHFFKEKGYDVKYEYSLKTRHVMVLAFGENNYYVVDENFILELNFKE